MATTHISRMPPPHVDPTEARQAYGVQAIPKLNKELGAPELLTRQQALATLCRMCRNPEHIKEALDAGMAGSLKKLLHGESKDADASVRQQATELLFHFAGHALGRQALLSHSLIEPLAALFDDSEDVVRKNAHATLERGTTAAAVAEAVVQSGLIPTLVGKLASEVDEIKELILGELHHCLGIDTEACLKANAMGAFISLLDHPSAEIRRGAAEDIMHLSFPLAGKDESVEKGAVSKLLSLAGDPSAGVKTAAIGALMSIGITTRGKKAALEAGAPARLIPLLDSTDEAIILNAIKAITVLAEAPAGREAFQPCVGRMDELIKKVGTHLDPQAISRAATKAKATIIWKP